jgi:hypothetical protein
VSRATRPVLKRSASREHPRCDAGSFCTGSRAVMQPAMGTASHLLVVCGTTGCILASWEQSEVQEWLARHGVDTVIPVRWVGEHQVKEDLGRIPTTSDWLRCIKPERWMGPTRKLEAELEPVPKNGCKGNELPSPPHPIVPRSGPEARPVSARHISPTRQQTATYGFSATKLVRVHFTGTRLRTSWSAP